MFSYREELTSRVRLEVASHEAYEGGLPCAIFPEHHNYL